MKYKGNIIKMITDFKEPVQYYLPIGDKIGINDKIEISNKKTEKYQLISLNSLIGKNVAINYHEQINCINCGVITKKSFHQGYCYSCFITVPQTDKGILHPEKDQSHLGISRDMEWAKKNALIDHYVYLAITGDIKVGVTRQTQIPTRWIDQGAIQAIKLARTPYRQLAGEIEVELKKHLSDKTNRNKMLQAKVSDLNLISKKEHYASFLSDNFKKYISLDNRLTNIKYPFENNNISKFNSISLNKNPNIKGKLAGIKAQYLIFENGDVFNVRKHNGYLIDFEVK